MFHEYYKIKKRLNSIVDTNVFDIDQKCPDYIYIKYHIYRESMRNIKIEEQDKVMRYQHVYKNYIYFEISMLVKYNFNCISHQFILIPKY